MRRIALTALIALAVLAPSCGPAAAERLVVSLSNHRVAVTSSFIGENLVLFGTVEPDNARTPLRPPYDLVVTVTGPRETMRTRRKERVLGVWINTDSREFVRAPSYLSILSNRPVAEITGQDALRRLQLGLDNFLLPQRFGSDLGDTARDDPFRAAFVRLETQQGLYREASTAVTPRPRNRLSTSPASPSSRARMTSSALTRFENMIAPSFAAPPEGEGTAPAPQEA